MSGSHQDPRPHAVPPILLVCFQGRLFLNDGHHRLVASRLLGMPIAAEVHGLARVYAMRLQA